MLTWKVLWSVEGEAQDEEEALDVVTRYHIAKRLPFPHMSLDSLTSQFHAVDFLPTLEAFIKHFIPHTKAKLTSHSRFDAFK